MIGIQVGRELFAVALQSISVESGCYDMFLIIAVGQQTAEEIDDHAVTGVFDVVAIGTDTIDA